MPFIELFFTVFGSGAFLGKILRIIERKKIDLGQLSHVGLGKVLGLELLAGARNMKKKP